jgi:hypothetical protein
MPAKHKLSMTARALDMSQISPLRQSLSTFRRGRSPELHSAAGRTVPGRKGLGWILIVPARDATRAEKCHSGALIFRQRLRLVSILEASLEFAARRGLLEADTAGGNLRLEVVLAFNWAGGEAAQHSNLADVGERVRDRSLEQAFGGTT